MRLPPDRTILKVARADAVYYGVAMGVTIGEIASVATNSHLGNYSLEIAFTLQLCIALIVEFLSGRFFTFSSGVVNTTLIGFYFKLLSAGLLLTGFILAYATLFYPAWLLITLSFYSDSMGTGCLKTAFRPAYNKLNLFLTGKPADFIVIYKKYLSIRLFVPLIILMSAVFFMFVLDEKIAVLAMFIIIIGLRAVQIAMTKSDLQCVAEPEFSQGATVQYKIRDSMPLISLTQLPNTLLFITGNVFESIVLLYVTGLIYQSVNFTDLPDYASWLGSSLISLAIYLSSTVVGRKIMAMTGRYGKSATVEYLLMALTFVSSLLLWLSAGKPFYVLALSLFSFIGATAGMIMMRMSVNRVMTAASESQLAGFFLIAETMTTLSVLAAVAVGNLFFTGVSVMTAFCAGLATLVAGFFTAAVCQRLKGEGR